MFGIFLIIAIVVLLPSCPSHALLLTQQHSFILTSAMMLNMMALHRVKPLMHGLIVSPPIQRKKTKCFAGSLPSLTLSKTSAPAELVSTQRSAIQASVNVNVVTDSQGLSNVDETVGEEQRLAHESPVKGKRHVNSKVCLFFCMYIPCQFTSPYLGNRQGQ